LEQEIKCKFLSLNLADAFEAKNFMKKSYLQHFWEILLCIKSLPEVNLV